jgi:phospholipid-binding lipoprotein MlaA
MRGTRGYRAAVLVLIGLLAGCATPASMPGSTAPAPPPADPGAGAADVTEVPSPDGSSDPEDAAAVPPADLGATLDTWDPWHRFNRGVYRFNARFDEAIHLPVATGYRRVVPREVRSGIGNFFGNLGEIGNTANHLLQARPGQGVRTAGRFLINSTLGIAGLFEVADRFGLSPHPTSFGDTLGRWGVGQGPYLVLPILGPSTLRDGLGAGVDLGINRAVNVADLYSGDSALVLGTVLAIDARSRIPFRYYESGSPFEYELVRFLYTRKRAIETGAMRAPAPTEAEPRAGTETDPPASKHDGADDPARGAGITQR